MLQKLTHSNFETIVLQVTTKCPYNCPQCYMKRGDHNMPINVAKSIVDEAVHLGAGHGIQHMNGVLHGMCLSWLLWYLLV